MVTLLVMNAVATQGLPLLMDKLIPEPSNESPITQDTIILILDVTLVLLFCEIVPSAVFTGTPSTVIPRSHGISQIW